MPNAYASPSRSFLQILDFDNAASEVKTTRWELETTLPERAGGGVRWIHLKAEPLNFGVLLKLVVKHLNPPMDTARAAAVCKLLEKFRREQERDSNHGRYFEAGSVTLDGVYFLALPYITYGTPPPVVNELRRALHPTRSLFQHYYRRESAKAIEGRDSDQICKKVRGAAGKDQAILVEYIWVLRLDEATVITVSSTAGDDLWWKLKLLDATIEVPPRRGGIDFDGQSLLFMQRQNSSSVTHLSKDVNEVLTDLIRVQWRIKEMLPQFLSRLLGRYEKYIIRLADVVQSYAFLRIAFKPRLVLLAGKGLVVLSTDRKWVDELTEDLCRFTEFVIHNIAQWQEFGTAEQYQSSEELQGQLITLYSKVLSYAAQFLKKTGPPLTKNMAWRQRVNGLFEDVKQLSAVLEWTGEAIRMKSEVFAAAGLPEEMCRPRDVEELVMLVINTLVPEDSIRTSRAYISEIYAQYLATLQFESQQAPSKGLVKNINQVAEELDIIVGIVKAQQKVLSRIKTESDVSAETLGGTLQKLEFFHSDMEEYKRSCARLSKLTAQNVEMQMEHHGKAIVVFTVVTIVFLPMSFVSSVFGMNVKDIREMENGQWTFWVAALAMTVVVVGLSLVVAFMGEDIVKALKGRSSRDEKHIR